TSMAAMAMPYRQPVTPSFMPSKNELVGWAKRITRLASTSAVRPIWIQTLGCSLRRSSISSSLLGEGVPGHQAQLDHHDGDQHGQQIPAPHVAEEPAIFEERPGDDRPRAPGDARRAPPVFEKTLVHELGEKTHFPSSM